MTAPIKGFHADSSPIEQLDAELAEYIARIAAIDAQYDAWSTRLDAALKQWEANRGLL